MATFRGSLVFCPLLRLTHQTRSYTPRGFMGGGALNPACRRHCSLAKEKHLCVLPSTTCNGPCPHVAEGLLCSRPRPCQGLVWTPRPDISPDWEHPNLSLEDQDCTSMDVNAREAHGHFILFSLFFLSSNSNVFILPPQLTLRGYLSLSSLTPEQFLNPTASPLCPPRRNKPFWHGEFLVECMAFGAAYNSKGVEPTPPPPIGLRGFPCRPWIPPLPIPYFPGAGF